MSLILRCFAMVLLVGALRWTANGGMDTFVSWSAGGIFLLCGFAMAFYGQSVRLDVRRELAEERVDEA